MEIMEQEDAKISSRRPALFLKSPEILLVECPEVRPVIVKTSGCMLDQHMRNTPQLYHPFTTPGDTKWPQKTSIHCWHCAHPFSGAPVPIARGHDPEKGVYYTFGIFCSAHCAKRFILDEGGHMTQLQLHIQSKMYREVYHLSGVIEPAESRTVLRKFCGSRGKSIEEFRAGFRDPESYRLEEPPFVQQQLALTMTANTPGTSFLGSTEEKNSAFDVPQRERGDECLFGEYLKTAPKRPRTEKSSDTKQKKQSVASTQKKPKDAKKTRKKSAVKTKADTPPQPPPIPPPKRSATRGLGKFLTFNH